MTDTAVAPAAEVPAVQASPKKTKAPKKAGGAKKPATKPTHPPAAEMVNAAIAALKDKKGSSLQAIKKYIAANYKVNVDKQSIFIKKYIKSAVTKKTIVQTKGTGAAGRFKLAAKAEGEKKKVVKKPTAAKKPAAAAAAKKPAAKKPKAAVKPKEGAAKKPAAAKKLAAAKKPAAAAKKAPAKPKVAKPVKAKTAKSPTKPKAPKPKKAVAPKAKAAPKK